MTVKIVTATARVRCNLCNHMLEYTEGDIKVERQGILDEEGNEKDWYYIICPGQSPLLDKAIMAVINVGPHIVRITSGEIE
jgi:hypothetical protein